MSFTKKKEKEYLKECEKAAILDGADIDGDIFIINKKMYYVNLLRRRIYFLRSVSNSQEYKLISKYDRYAFSILEVMLK